MFKTLKGFDVKNKRVLVRCDLNVPLDKNGNIADDFRIRAILPTIDYLLTSKAKIILMSHLGSNNNILPSLNIVKKKLEKLLGINIKMTNDCIGAGIKNSVNSLLAGEILLLENLRIHKEEAENNADFSKKLAELGDIYINDAFAVCHRSHASVVGVPKFLPSGAGLLLEKEIIALSKIMENPERPMIVLVGGIKVETKTKFIEKISSIADEVIISGLIKKEILEKELRFNNEEKIISPENDLEALDIGSDYQKLFRQKILTAKTILWNGPFGRFEDEKYKKGTLAIANAIIESGAFSVVGGGETIEFLTKEGIISKFSHVSTGGAAMLQFLSGDTLPGVVALE